MAPQIKLTRGNTSLDLTAAPYSVGKDFTPPALNPAYNIAAGSSANRIGGGSLISDRYNNRQISFSVRIQSTSTGGTHAAALALAAFVKADNTAPLYLEYREDTTIPVPLWGQFGAPLRYEVITADIGSPDDNFTRGRRLAWFVPLALEVKPFAVGNRQKLANASGGVFEDNYGMADGTPRGVAMFRATTNKIANPVFGNSTYTTDWTAGANLIVSKNQDPRYTLPGVMQSVRLTARAGTNNTFTQSVNAGNTNPHALSAYIMAADGGTVTTADFGLYYNTDLTASSNLRNVGGALWLASASALTGINAGTPTGVIVKNGRSIILLGMQFEETTYATQPIYGDLLGCTWNGTAHATTVTSTRAASYLAIARDDAVCTLAEGAVSMIYRPNTDTSASLSGGDLILFGLYASGYASSGIVARIESSDQKIYLTDGTNTISTAAQAWTALTTQYLTFTWGPGGLNIYINGANAATGATYTPASAANQVHLAIGNANGANVIDGWLLGFDVYGEELSAAQVGIIYAAQAAAVTANRRVSAIPYLWTADGLGDIYNHDDSGFGHNNWAVIGGVDGSAPAQYAHYFASNTTSKTAYWMGGYSIPSGPFDKPDAQWYEDQSGTVDAGSSGGEYETDGSNPFDYAITMSRNTARSYSFFIRMAGSGAGTITVTPYLQSGSGLITGTPKACAVTTTQTLYYIGTMTLEGKRDFDNDIFYPADNVSAIFHGEYSAISSRVDFILVIPNEIVKIDQGVNNAIGASQDYISYNGRRAYLFTVAGVLSAEIPVWGTELVVDPNRLNFVWVVIGDHSEAHVISDYITLTTYIAPRYGLL